MQCSATTAVMLLLSQPSTLCEQAKGRGVDSLVATKTGSMWVIRRRAIRALRRLFRDEPDMREYAATRIQALPSKTAQELEVPTCAQCHSMHTTRPQHPLLVPIVTIAAPLHFSQGRLSAETISDFGVSTKHLMQEVRVDLDAALTIIMEVQ